MPVTVTGCGAFQFNGVKTKEAGDTVPSVVSELDKSIVTVSVGSEFRTTENVSLPPSSVVLRPDVGLTVIPALSLSVLETTTSSTGKPSYAGSALEVLEVTIV